MQLTALRGPSESLELVQIDSPRGNHFLTSEPGVLIEVRAAGVSFPEVLQTRGQYQYQPELPFVPGGEVAGTVLSAPDGAGFEVGDRVAAFCVSGGFAERAVAPPFLTFKLDSDLSFAQGAGLVLNYHTAYFALSIRGRAAAGETVLIHGAAGGLGMAAIQVAKGLGMLPIAVVSSDAKEEMVRQAGVEAVVRSGEGWRQQVLEIRRDGVDLVFDSVGGDRTTDSLRSLRTGGRLLVVGFAGGEIPTVRLNRLLLKNLAVVGVGWGAHVFTRPDACREIGAAVSKLVREGFVRPVIGASYPLDHASRALSLIDSREATGKVILEIGRRTARRS